LHTGRKAAEESGGWRIPLRPPATPSPQIIPRTRIKLSRRSLVWSCSGEFTSPRGGVKPPLVRLKACSAGGVEVPFRHTLSGLQLNVTATRRKARLRRETVWEATGGERPVRTIRNSIRPIVRGEPAREWRSPDLRETGGSPAS
jgi:hypothetical protein